MALNVSSRISGRHARLRPSDAGLTLILVAGILTLLAVAGSVFVRFSIGLRARTGVELDRTQARLLARSGVQYASARLFQTTEVPKAPTAENQADDWTYRDGAGFPLEKSLNPSYSQAEPFQDVVPNGKYDEGGDPYADLDHNGRFDSWSGRLLDRHGTTAGTFILKMFPESGKINVNGGWLDAGNRNGVDGNTIQDHCDVEEIRNRRYVLLLDNLGQVVNVSTTSQDPKVLQNGAGSRLGDLLKGRPRGGFQSMGQVRGSLSFPDWEKVRDFLTVAETERANFSVSDRTGMAGSSGYIRRLGAEARPLVNLALASRETLQALTLGLIVGDYRGVTLTQYQGAIDFDPVLSSKTADCLSQRRFASWYDLYSQLHRDQSSVCPPSVAEEAYKHVNSLYNTVRAWAHIVLGNLIADEVGGYGPEDEALITYSAGGGYKPVGYNYYPPMSWLTYDTPRALPYPDVPHFRDIHKMGPAESDWGTSDGLAGHNIIVRWEGGRPLLPSSSHQTLGLIPCYKGGTLEVSLIPRESVAVSVDCLGRTRTDGGRSLASATASSLVRFGTIVSARTQAEFENFLEGNRGPCRVTGRPFKDRLQTEPQFSVDSLPKSDLESYLASYPDSPLYSPFWGTIRLADRSGYRQGERFYVPAWDVDQPLRPSSASAAFRDNFQDVSGSTDFVYAWNIRHPTFPADKTLTPLEAEFRGDRAASLQCAAAPGVSAPGTYTWLAGKKFPLVGVNGNVTRGSAEFWTPGRPGGWKARQLGLYWKDPTNPLAAADIAFPSTTSGGMGVVFSANRVGTIGHSSRPVVYGDWNHLIVALDAESTPSMVGYVNGLPDPLLTNDDWLSSALNTAYPPKWEMANRNSDQLWGGYLGTESDEIRLYDRVLGQGEAMGRALSSRFWTEEHFPPSDWPPALQDRLAAVPSFTSPLYVFDRLVAPDGARWDGFVPQLIREAIDGPGGVPGGAGIPSLNPPIKVDLLCWDHVPAGQEPPQKTVPFPEGLWRSGGGWADFKTMWRSAYGDEPIPRFRAFRYKVWMDCSAINGFNGETPVFDSISMAFKTGAQLLDAREE